MTVTIRDLQQALLASVYNTVVNFPGVAETMTQLEARNASGLVVSQSLGLAPESSCDFTGLPMSMVETKSLIQCHDANGRYILEDVDEWTEHVNYLVNQSSYLGAAWAIAGGMCRTYDIRPPRSQVFHGYSTGTKTATPILFVENRLDPVTPAAGKMRKFFEDNVLVTVDAVGHGVVGVKNQCVIKVMTKYFEDGVLPEGDVDCDADVQPFFMGTQGSVELSSILKRM